MKRVSRDARRKFIKQSSILTAIAIAPAKILEAAEMNNGIKEYGMIDKMKIQLEINGITHHIFTDPRSTLLDILREDLKLTGTKKGCDRGQCGACTIHVDGDRVNACLSLAISHDGKKITTIEGVSKGLQLHPMQEAFIVHDGFQCGYCTSGQIMSAIALLAEGHADSPSEIKEFMSGNICRCGAYPNIVKAIQEVKNGTKK